ncbi:hypothetical protein GOBAR_DD20889 [Gossypium barbadense]|nr:hypothetical protein GOBAR_DD20889 [Gossypium barbadense]
MEQPASSPNTTPRGSPRSKDPQMDVHLPVTEADPSSSSVWDWGDLLDFTLDDHFSISLDDGNMKRDPRMTCSNFLTGRVPCACPEIDEQMEKLEEEEAGAPGKKRARTGRVGSGTSRCQIPGCEVDITELKGYHRRHRVCLQCANSSTVLINGESKRYCQQCGKFHLLSDFDEGKRSCRRKLERHNNRRRRKPVGSKTEVNKESLGAVQSEDIACDGEAGKDDLSLSGQTAEDPPFESEDGLVSADCSAPMLQTKVLQNLKNVMEEAGFNGTDDPDTRLLKKYMDYGRDILNNKLQEGERPVLLSEYIEQEGKWNSQSSLKNDGLFVPNGSQDLGERTNAKFQTMMASTTLTRSETVPLLNKEIVMNVNLSKELPRKSCSTIFATTTLRSCPALFVVATAAICLGICAVFLHPNRVGEFAVTIRRCLSKRSYIIE